MTVKKIGRRELLKSLGMTAAGAALAACQPQTVIVKETVVVEEVVEKEVEKTVVIKETVIVEGTPQVQEKVVTATPPPAATATPLPIDEATGLQMKPREDPSRVLVNGKEVEARPMGVLMEVEVPPGECKLEIVPGAQGIEGE